MNMEKLCQECEKNVQIVKILVFRRKKVVRFMERWDDC